MNIGSEILDILIFSIFPTAIFAVLGTFFFRAATELVTKQNIRFDRAYAPIFLGTYLTYLSFMLIAYLSTRKSENLSILSVLILFTMVLIVGIIAHSVTIKWLLKLDLKKTILISCLVVLLYTLLIVFMFGFLPWLIYRF